MVAVQLPPELHDAIIDYFYDDPAMLARCALVGRSWLPAVRFHSWHHLSLKCTTSSLRRFSEVLDASPVIAYYVRDVVVTQKKSQFCTWEDLHLLDAALALLSRLPNLLQLTLDGLWFGGPAEDISGAYQPTPYIFPSVRSLVISTCSFQAFADVQNLCAAFPALRSVHFDGIWWGHWMAVGQSTRVRAEPLHVDKGALQWKELNLGSCFSRNAVIEWLLDSLTEDTLRSLRLPLIGAYDSRLKDLLAHVGHNLQHLEIGCPSTSAGHVQGMCITFSESSHLTHSSVQIFTTAPLLQYHPFWTFRRAPHFKRSRSVYLRTAMRNSSHVGWLRFSYRSPRLP